MKQVFTKSRNYDMRCAKLPKLEQVIKSYIGQCMFQSRVTKNLQEKSLEGVIFTVLIPDTAASLGKKEKINNDNVAEDALDESNEKKSKKSTTFTPVDRISGLDTVLKTLTNLKLIIALYSDVDLDAVEDTGKWPIIIVWVQECQDIITDEEATEWAAKCGDKVEGVKLAYYIVNSWMGILCKFASLVNDPVQQSKALEADWIGIKMDSIQKAKKQYKHMMEVLDNVYAGNLEVPDSALWKESADKAEHEKVQTMLLRQKLMITNSPPKQPTSNATPKQANTQHTKPAKSGKITPGTESTGKVGRPKTHNDLPALGADGHDGYIIGSGPASWDLPKLLDGKRPVLPGQPLKFSLCKKHYKKGQTCKYGQTCNRSHKAPMDLEPVHFKALWEFMHDNTHNLSWNTELVDMEELKQKYESLSV